MGNSSDTRPLGGIERLYGAQAFARLEAAHVCVIGLGGVGSWCAEALARTAIGRLTLIDGDCVASSNINRQLPALLSTIGRPKAEVLAERFAQINPQAVVTAVVSFIRAENPGECIPPDALIVEAIDDMKAKAALVAWASRERRTIFVAGGAGGRIDPGRVTSADIARAKGDPLLSRLRTTLRKQYGFPSGAADPHRVKPFGIIAAYTDEPMRGCSADASVSASAGYGTSTAVTATLGLRLASLAIGAIIG
ncbi:MAG: tRNA threonylcarbamoyladenosine dehydratase [Duodenibacillus sp.]|nr:tRNA threonylcarbamoyladenosine dehydratase [Duodenibacillus sp.]